MQLLTINISVVVYRGPPVDNGENHLKPALAIDGIKGEKSHWKFAHSSVDTRYKGETFYVDLDPQANSQVIRVKDLTYIIVYPSTHDHHHRYKNYTVGIETVNGTEISLTPMTSFIESYVKAHFEDGLRWDLRNQTKLDYSDFLLEEIYRIVVRQPNTHISIAEIEVFYGADFSEDKSAVPANAPRLALSIKNGPSFYYCNQLMNYTDAKDYCNSFGLDVAVPIGASENEALWQSLQNKLPPITPALGEPFGNWLKNAVLVWLGLEEVAPNQWIRSSDGSAFPDTSAGEQFLWKSGEPIDGWEGGEHCANLYVEVDNCWDCSKAWNDAGCHFDNLYPVCEDRP